MDKKDEAETGEQAAEGNPQPGSVEAVESLEPKKKEGDSNQPSTIDKGPDTGEVPETPQVTDGKQKAPSGQAPEVPKPETQAALEQEQTSDKEKPNPAVEAPEIPKPEEKSQPDSDKKKPKDEQGPPSTAKVPEPSKEQTKVNEADMVQEPPKGESKVKETDKGPEPPKGQAKVKEADKVPEPPKFEREGSTAALKQGNNNQETKRKGDKDHRQEQAKPEGSKRTKSDSHKRSEGDGHKGSASRGVEFSSDTKKRTPKSPEERRRPEGQRRQKHDADAKRTSEPVVARPKPGMPGKKPFFLRGSAIVIIIPIILLMTLGYTQRMEGDNRPIRLHFLACISIYILMMVVQASFLITFTRTGNVNPHLVFHTSIFIFCSLGAMAHAIMWLVDADADVKKTMSLVIAGPMLLFLVCDMAVIWRGFRYGYRKTAWYMFGPFAPNVLEKRRSKKARMLHRAHAKKMQPKSIRTEIGAPPTMEKAQRMDRPSKVGGARIKGPKPGCKLDTKGRPSGLARGSVKPDKPKRASEMPATHKSTRPSRVQQEKLESLKQQERRDSLKQREVNV